MHPCAALPVAAILHRRDSLRLSLSQLELNSLQDSIETADRETQRQTERLKVDLDSTETAALV